MEEGSGLKYFVRSLILLIRIRNNLGDRFFSEKLENKIAELIGDYVGLQKRDRDNVAQHLVRIEAFSADIVGLLELLQELNYLGLVKTSPLLLQANKLLLLLKLETVRERKARNVIGVVKPEKDANLIESSDSLPVTARKSKPSKIKKLNANREKILNFIKSFPEARTKDIIHEFNALSDRTVKRNLTELLQTGLVKKRIENKAVFYSTID